jgi:hypothetical protein
MANTITGLIPTLYKAADRVLREQQGFLGSVYLDPSAEQAAKDQNITYPIVPTIAAADVTPAAVPTEPTSLTISYGTMTINKVRKASFFWNGEDQQALGNIYDNVKLDQFSQAFRTLSNEVETDLFLAAKAGSSRAYGTAGTTPFATASDLTDVAQVRKILADNGAWTGDMHMVLSTTSGAKIRGTQANLFKVNESGTADMLRDGRLGNLEGFALHESSAIVSHTKGTGASYVTNGSTAVGVSDVALITGTGTVLAGDVVTFAADANNKYVIGTGVAAPGTISLAKPGARVTIATSNALTVGNSYTGNFAFERNAIHLLTRVPKLPKEGALGQHEVITDPFSGISFLVSMYPGYHEIIVEVSLAWGVKAVKSEAIATLLG